jgi:hypothetical protein
MVNSKSKSLPMSFAALVVAAAMVVTAVVAGADRVRSSAGDSLSNKSPALQEREKHSKRKGASQAPPRGGIAGAPVNDDCANALPVNGGNTPFSTIGATTDGLSHPECLSYGDDNVNQDIWFTYTASQTDVLNLSLCSSMYDTRAAVYDGCGVCPPTDLLFCNDDSCGLQSQITGISVIAGNCYTIRIGGYDIASGTGQLSLSLIEPELCGGAGQHDCCTSGGPGCNDIACCEAVCSQDAFCCDAQWDQICVGLADELCAELCPEACSKDNPQDCFKPGKLPGCKQPECCENICASDPFCCQVAWDQSCADEALQWCEQGCLAPCPAGAVAEFEICGDDINGGCDSIASCSGPFPDCCIVSGVPGCSDPACTASICGADPFCCDVAWDELCADAACKDAFCDCEPSVSDPFQFIDCGDTICGTHWASTTLRDTDWYQFNVYECGTIATWTVYSEFPAVVRIISGPCPPVILNQDVNCPSVASAELFPGTYFLYVAPAAFIDFPCRSSHSEYSAALTCDVPCPADINGSGGGPNGFVDVDDLLKVINNWGACK